MADGEKIGGAFVEVEADLTRFDAALDSLPAKMRSKMGDAMRSLQAQMAQAKLDLKVAVDAAKLTGNTAPVVALTALQEQLKDKIDAVSAAATRQAQALQAAASAQAAATAQARTAAQAASAQAAAVQAQAAAAQRLAAGQAGWGGTVAPRGMTDAQMAAVTKAGGDPRLAGLAGMPGGDKLDQLGKAGQRAGEQIRAGGMSGAMGLMVLSQTIDDAQYGFRSIVNNIPMLGMSIGNALGMGAEAGMKFGAIAGIVGVAINLLITHWDKFASLLGLGHTKTEAERMDELAKATNRTAEETAKLNKYKKEQAEIEKLRGGEPEARREAREAMEKAFGEGDFEKIRGGLAGQMKRAMMPDEIEIIRAAGEAPFAGVGGGGNVPVMGRPATVDPVAAEARRQKRRDEIDEKINQEALEAADKLIAKAALGDEAARAAVLAKMDQVPGAFPKGARERVAFTDVEQQQAREEEAMRAEREAASRELGKELTRQGQEQQDAHFAAVAAERSREAGRLAGAMDRSVGTGLLLDPKMAQDELDGKIRKALEAAGVAADEIGKLIPEISVKLREKFEHAIQDRAAERGISPAEARVQLLKEEREKDIADRKKAGGVNQIFSDEEYSRRLMMATQSGQGVDRTPQEQLTALKDANKKLEELVKLNKAKPTNGVARFAGGRARP